VNSNNAIKFTNEGAVSITAAAVPYSNEIVVSITDTGISLGVYPVLYQLSYITTKFKGLLYDFDFYRESIGIMREKRN
jgi:hypothetical protein